MIAFLLLYGGDEGVAAKRHEEMAAHYQDELSSGEYGDTPERGSGDAGLARRDGERAQAEVGLLL